MIRAAVPSDALHIAKVHVQAWHESYRGIVPDEVLAALSIDTRTTQWADALSKPQDGSAIFVSMAIDERIIGFGSCGTQRSNSLPYPGEFYAIYVLQTAQQCGNGKMLMSVMSRHLAEQELHSASLWVVRENTGARQFYERLGGVVIAEKEDIRESCTLIEVAYAWDTLPITAA